MRPGRRDVPTDSPLRELARRGGKGLGVSGKACLIRATNYPCLQRDQPLVEITLPDFQGWGLRALHWPLFQCFAVVPLNVNFSLRYWEPGFLPMQTDL